MDESLLEIPEFEISPSMQKYLCTRSGMRAFNAALKHARLNILLVPYSEFTLPPSKVPEDYFVNGDVGGISVIPVWVDAEHRVHLDECGPEGMD